MTNKPEEGPHVPDTVALLEAQAKEIAELRVALKPFADIADLYEDTVEGNKICVPIGDFRAARAALGEKE